MTPDEAKQLADIEEDRKERERLLLLLLLGLCFDAETAARNVAVLSGSVGDAIESIVLRPVNGLPAILRQAADSAFHSAVDMSGSIVPGDYEPPRQPTPGEYKGAVDPQKFTDALVKRIRKSLGDDESPASEKIAEAFDAAGVSRENSKMLAEVAATQINAGYQPGLFGGFQGNPIVTGLKFLNPNDQFTGPICKVRVGVQLPKNDRWWLRNLPLLHWGCRSSVVAIVGSFVATKSPPNLPAPQPGFGFAPTAWTHAITTSAHNLSMIFDLPELETMNLGGGEELTGGEWKTINGARVYIKGGVAVAGPAHLKHLIGRNENEIHASGPHKDADLWHGAIKEFGTTKDPHEAGYVLPDGRMLDFSGKRDGGTPGERSYDHREINRADGIDSMQDAMSKGAVRFSKPPDGSVVVHHSQPMTETQKRVIAKHRGKNEWAVERWNADGNTVSHDEGDAHEHGKFVKSLENHETHNLSFADPPELETLNLSAEDDMGGHWRTISGAHVLIGSDGTILKGPARLSHLIGKHHSELTGGDKLHVRIGGEGSYNAVTKASGPNPPTLETKPHAPIVTDKSFARNAQAAAQRVSARGPGAPGVSSLGDKVLVSHAHAEYEKAHGAMPLAMFKQRLSDVNGDDHGVSLVREDLVPAEKAGEFAASEVKRGVSSYHYIRTGKPGQAAPRSVDSDISKAHTDAVAKVKARRAANTMPEMPKLETKSVQHGLFGQGAVEHQQPSLIPGGASSGGSARASGGKGGSAPLFGDPEPMKTGKLFDARQAMLDVLPKTSMAIPKAPKLETVAVAGGVPKEPHEMTSAEHAESLKKARSNAIDAHNKSASKGLGFPPSDPGKLTVPQRGAIAEKMGMKPGSPEYIKAATEWPQHKLQVGAAMAEGKSIPAHVAAEYPDLAKKSPVLSPIVDPSLQFGLFAKDASGAPAEIGEKIGQANLFGKAKYAMPEPPKLETRAVVGSANASDPKHTAEIPFGEPKVETAPAAEPDRLASLQDKLSKGWKYDLGSTRIDKPDKLRMNRGSMEFRGKSGWYPVNEYHGERMAVSAGLKKSAAQVAGEEIAKRRAAGHIIGGNTYEHREAIRSAGGLWDPDRKQWAMPDKESADKIRSLVSPPATSQKLPSAPQDNPNEYSWGGGSGYGYKAKSVGETFRNDERGIARGEPEYLTATTTNSRYIRDDGMSFGVGDERGYLHTGKARAATAEEISPLKSHDEASGKAKSARSYMRDIATHITSTGERPTGENNPIGETFNIGPGHNVYGGGEHFVIGDQHIWHVRNNGADGDDWSQNNIRTGGAGAIGHRVPYTPELADKIRKASAAAATHNLSLDALDLETINLDSSEVGSNGESGWKTIQGSRVYIDDDGAITKGAAHLVGKKVSDLPPRSKPMTEKDHHREAGKHLNGIMEETAKGAKADHGKIDEHHKAIETHMGHAEELKRKNAAEKSAPHKMPQKPTLETQSAGAVPVDVEVAHAAKSGKLNIPTGADGKIDPHLEAAYRRHAEKHGLEIGKFEPESGGGSATARVGPPAKPELETKPTATKDDLVSVQAKEPAINHDGSRKGGAEKIPAKPDSKTAGQKASEFLNKPELETSSTKSKDDLATFHKGNARPGEGKGEKIPDKPKLKTKASPMDRAEKSPKPESAKPYSRERLASELVAHHESVAGAGTYSADDEAWIHSHSSGSPFVYDEKSAGEVKSLVGDNHALKRIFRKAGPGEQAGFADAYGADPKRYEAIANSVAGSPLKAAVHTAENSADPELRLKAAIHETPEEGRGKALVEQSVDKMKVGDKATVKGVEIEKAIGADGKPVIKDRGDLPETPADALTTIPIDKGSFKAGPPDKPALETKSWGGSSTPPGPAFPAAEGELKPKYDAQHDLYNQRHARRAGDVLREHMDRIKQFREDNGNEHFHEAVNDYADELDRRTTKDRAQRDINGENAYHLRLASHHPALAEHGEAGVNIAYPPRGKGRSGGTRNMSMIFDFPELETVAA